MAHPLVSLITPNLNGERHLETFLESVRAQDFPAEELEVIVVDNGSSDGSLELLARRYSEVTVIRNETNLGFAAANNQAAERAAGRYLALLNNDMRLEPDWLRRMVAALEDSSPETTCVGSRILSWDGSAVDFIGGTMSFNGIGFHTSFGAPADSAEGQAFPEELLFASGAAMVVERETFRSVGGFDDDYFAYYEDVDFGWRLWILGFRVAFCADAVAFHRRNVSLPRRHQTAYLLERNALFTVVKNYEDDSLAKLLPAALLLAFHRSAARSGAPGSEFEPVPERPPGRLLRRSDPTEQMRIRREGYATVAAVDQVMAQLPRLMEKRRLVQSARRRGDREIAHLFRTPLGPGPAAREGVEFEALRALGVVDFFEYLLVAAPSG